MEQSGQDEDEPRNKSDQRNVSVARWDPVLGVAEVLEKKGKSWGSTGFNRKSKTYCHVEEAVYMAEQGTLLLLEGDEAIPPHQVYNLLLNTSGGCSWEAYQIFCHLKRFGYIVGRHDTIWSTSSKQRQPLRVDSEADSGDARYEVDPASAGLTPPAIGDVTIHEEYGQSSEQFSVNSEREEGQKVARAVATGCFNPRRSAEPCRDSRADSLGDVHLPVVVGGFASLSEKHESHGDLPSMLTSLKVSVDRDGGSCTKSPKREFNMMFDVYLPDSNFRKTSPGSPAFTLCMVDGRPPEHSLIRELEISNRGRPIKFGFVASGHVSIFSFTSCALPTLE